MGTVAALFLILFMNGHTLRLNQMSKLLWTILLPLRAKLTTKQKKQNNFADKVAKFCICMHVRGSSGTKGKVPNQ